MSERSVQLEAKWQERWYSARINEAEVDGRPKFMLIFAYPGVTGYLHVGHMRGFTYVDAIGRFKRLEGYNVLFPVGTHATGNGAISLAARIARKDQRTIDYLCDNTCPVDMLESLKDPLKVVEFFNAVYVNQYWKRFGFLSDWRRFTSTVNPDYQMFIRWQFLKLMEKGLLIQRPYYAPACVCHGPVAIDASETDIQCGGSAETLEYTLLKFKCGDMYLVAATLRPETVFGQTNFWANPEAEYAKARVGNETWVVSTKCLEKLMFQKDGIEPIGSLKGSELIGLSCIAPMVHREVLVLPADFVDPAVGTGLVTSVPSDSPDDWVALRALQRDEATLRRYGLDVEKVRAITPIAIIEMKGWSPLPAVEVTERMGIEAPGDPRLEEAKRLVYKDGFHIGRMNDTAGEYAGLPVMEAKEKIRQAMVSAGEADVMYDLSEPVICRCGSPVLIKKVDDQWFIDYANPEVTAAAHEQARKMVILPPEYYQNIHGVLDWFRERACVRQGNWIGTRFPFDEKWIIEAISDSTLYPLYYTISKFANDGSVRPEQMTEEFFDLVVLDKGDAASVSARTGVPQELLMRIREEVHYWYPLDLNLGGKEHMTVHFPAFLMNHVAILPPEMLPRGIFVNWYVVGKGGKISKSKGGAQPIPGAAERFGIDALRLYYAHIASPHADVEWEDEAVESYTARVERMERLLLDLMRMDGQASTVDGWLVSRMANRAGWVREAMKGYDIRTLANEVFFEAFNDLRWYQRRGGGNAATVRRVMDILLPLMMPITPHLAEELWEMSGHEGFVSTTTYPEALEGEIDPAKERAEDYLMALMEDANEILKVTGIRPRRMTLFTSPAWKHKVLAMAIGLHAKGELKVPTLTKMAMADEEVRAHGKEASDYARRMAEELMKRSSPEVQKMAHTFDERAFLESSRGFLEREYGCIVEVHGAEERGASDPQHKARQAAPGRPAIIVE
ncbi:MAG TPA: leucine--tRNA ligase [Methanomassiliicoccales archaeon]|nr:leucine--tRNA ligase [Methanomassiliicoccales archaeon]